MRHLTGLSIVIAAAVSGCDRAAIVAGESPSPYSVPSLPATAPGAEAWLPHSAYNSLYPPGVSIDLEGRVEEVTTFAPEPGAMEGLQLTLSTPSGPVVVHVGPRAYPRSRGMEFQYKDLIGVIGRQVAFEGRTVVMARQVTRGEQVLLLRDETGRPLWDASALQSRSMQP